MLCCAARSIAILCSSCMVFIETRPSVIETPGPKPIQRQEHRKHKDINRHPVKTDKRRPRLCLTLVSLRPCSLTPHTHMYHELVVSRAHTSW